MDISQYSLNGTYGPQSGTRTVAKPSTTDFQSAASAPQSPAAAEGGFSLFDAVVDTVNPLQHIPGVSSVYQQVTGDESSALANMAGGFLFGGPMGLAAGAATSFLEFLTGKSLLGHAQALFEGVPDTPKQQLADAGSGLAQDTESILKDWQQAGGATLQNYQAFAAAHTETKKGFGATSKDVSWSDNIWTAHALKEASGLYENSQNLTESRSRQQGQQA